MSDKNYEKLMSIKVEKKKKNFVTFNEIVLTKL